MADPQFTRESKRKPSYLPGRLLIAIAGLCLFTSFVATHSASAGVFIRGSLAWLEILESDANTGATVPSERRVTSTSAGYAFSQGFILGAQGLTSLSSPSSRSSWSAGPMGGLLIGGFEATAAYLPFARETRDSAGGKNIYSGGGFAANVGYTWKVAGPLRLGLHATYWSVGYNKRDGERLNSPFRVATIAPLVSMALHF